MFCTKRGARLLPKCPKCGSKVEEADDFCGHCGHDLRKAAEGPPIDYSQPRSCTPKHLADKVLDAQGLESLTSDED